MSAFATVPVFATMEQVSSEISEVFHIVRRAEWEEALRRGQYAPSSLETEGFIHCSTRSQVAETANRWYTGQADLIMVAIDPRRLTATLRFEPPLNPSDERRAERFPHLYGPLNLDAVTEAMPFPPDAGGRFRFPTQTGRE